jgi:hydrogenase nickel incorporation protein HypA/HybF
MHELSLSSAIVATALRHAGGARVVAVRVRVGALRQAVPEALEFAFELVARETACAGARLEQERVPAVLACGECGEAHEVREPPLLCRSCGSADVEVVTGNELEIESIEVEVDEVEDAACTGRS